MITLYTTNCPKCKVLESKLMDKKIPYVINENIDNMLELGIRTAPVLEIEDKLLEFADAVKWVNEQ